MTTEQRRPPKEPVIPAGNSLFGRILYGVLWVLCRTLGVSLFGFRVRFAEPLPATGGLLVLSSHQSHLDPLLLGLACDRKLSSLARSSLFHFGPFGAVISALDAVPIDRNASMVAAMRAVIDRLKQGKAVVVHATDFTFPGVMAVGDELSVYAEVVATGTTSLTIAARGVGRERNGEATVDVARGQFKFVLLGEDDRPRAVTQSE